ncbi:MAG: hypothetical protein R3C12_24185 [Planctomycetaceae bacterium]
MTSNAENSTGLKEDSKLTKVIGLMACGALASASLWLFNLSQAQDQEISGTPPRQTQSPAGNPWAEADASDPFGQVTNGFQSGTTVAPVGEQTVIRKRIQDELRLAELARHEGRNEEALRRATAARDLAVRFNIAFDKNELNPHTLIAQLAPSGSKPPASSQEEQAQYAAYLVRAAREDLKAGNAEAAYEKARTAQGLKVAYGPFDDRPEHLLADIARMQAAGVNPGSTVVSAPLPGQAPVANAPSTEIYPTEEHAAKKQSQQLLAAAEQAIQEGRYEEARKFAAQAGELPVVYNLFDRRPEQILAMIERASDSRMIVAREQKPQATTPESTSVPVAIAVPEMTSTPSTSPSANDNAREQALALLAEARQAVSRGDLQTANAKVEQARQFDVAYTLFDDRPEMIVAHINAIQKQQMLARQQPTEIPAGPWATDSSSRPMTVAAVTEAPTAVPQAPAVGTQAPSTSPAPSTTPAPGITPTPSTVAEAPTGLPRTPADNPQAGQKAAVVSLLNQSKALLEQGQLEQARAKAREAMQYDVAYDVFDLRPQQLLAEIDRRDVPSRTPTMVATNEVTPVEAALPTDSVKQNQVVTADVAPPQLTAAEAYREGVQLMRNGEREAARQIFLVAYQQQEELNPVQQQQLRDFLRQLSVKRNTAIEMVNNQVYDQDVNSNPSRIDLARQQQSIEYDRLRSETFNTIYQAERLRETDPEKALQLIDQAVTKLAETSLAPEVTDSLASQLRRSRGSIEKYKNQREPLIALEKRNDEVRSQIEQERKVQIRIEQDLADMTEEFNRLMRERRYPEAEIVAKKAKELAPEEPVAEMMVWKAKFARRIASNDELKDAKEESFWQQLDSVEWSAVNPVAKDSIAYPDAKDWKALTKNRQQFGGPDNRQRSAEELEIIESLNQPISLHFDNEPLSEVFRQIAMLADMNIWTDEQGLEEVGASSNTPVTMHIDGIKLKSALKLLLEPYGLDYNIADDVLKVTSSLRLQGELIPVVYNVADLVVPLPVMAGQFSSGTSGLAGRRFAGTGRQPDERAEPAVRKLAVPNQRPAGLGGKRRDYWWKQRT